MSSDDESMRGTVAEEAAEQIDVAKLIGEGLEEGVNGKELGLAVGRWGGRRWGRSVGESFGATVHEILASGPENRNFREVVSDAREGAVSRISDRTEAGRERIEEGEERVKEEATKVTEDKEEEDDSPGYEAEEEDDNTPGEPGDVS